MSSWPDETASRAVLGPGAVVWRLLNYNNDADSFAQLAPTGVWKATASHCTSE